jgi:hypothetical protein
LRKADAVSLLVILMIAPAHAGAQGGKLLHDWKQERSNSEIRLTSTHPAPIPFSTTGEPEATLTITATKRSADSAALTERMKSEVARIRKNMRIAEYLEKDGHKPERDIATFYEEVNGKQVGFIKYRTAGAAGRPAATPRTVIEALCSNDAFVYSVELIVLYSGHQDEVRADQITLIKGLVGK